MSAELPTIAENWALFLDVDGTLLDLEPRPDAVAVPRGLRETLAALHRRLGGALALVSGRAIADLDRIFAPLRLPAAGQHGAERRRRADSAIMPTVPRTDFAILLARLESFAAANPDVIIEFKGNSVAVHCRRDPKTLAAAGLIVAQAVTDSGGALDMLPAHGGFDVKPSSASKRRAIDAFMAEQPFHGRVPVFAGDDATDEGAFAATIERAGHAIRVGEGTSLAPLRVADPTELRRWLGVSIEAREARS